MLDKFRYTAATDKDVFDLLASGGARLGRKALFEIALGRGTFHSSKTDRDQIISDVSMWMHDYYSVSDMVQRREHGAYIEKRSFVELPVELSKEDLNRVISQYKKSVTGAEEVSTKTQTANQTRLNVAYDEIDYSKTRLIQRQRKDAAIDVEIGEKGLVFRMPANERSRRIVEGLCAEVRKIKLTNADASQISLAGLTSDERTLFFVTMINNIEGYRLQTVVGMKFAKMIPGEESEDEEEDEEARVEPEVISHINRIAIAGENLIQTPEYQQLRRNGFFFTALTWRSKQLEKPNDLMQFDVSFDDPQEGIGFKFGVRKAKNAESVVSIDFQVLEASRQPSMWRLIERASAKALRHVRARQAEGDS